MIRPRCTTLLGALTATLAGCNSPAYFAGSERLVIDAEAVAMAEDGGHPIAGAFVQSEYWLDFEPPTADELADLQPPDADPSTYVPWIARDDLDISVQWTLTNDSDQPLANVFVTLDGATEFFDYDPLADYGLAGGEDAEEPVFPTLLGFTPFALEPGEVRRGEFREDDLTEAMYDLDVMSRFCGGPFAVIYNRHEDDPIGTGQVPPEATIAGFVMLRISLAAPGPASLEYAIRVRDRDGVLFDSRQDDARYEVVPEPFTPALGLGGVPMEPVDPMAEPMTCMVGGDP